MPPRILALILTLVQSNSAILIGSLDSTAPAPIGASTAAASAARPITPLFNPLLLIALLVLLPSPATNRAGSPLHATATLTFVSVHLDQPRCQWLSHLKRAAKSEKRR